MSFFPIPFRELSTRRVLTSTFLEGKKIGDVTWPSTALGIDRPKIVANRLLRAYCQMIFVDGVYHADPHPGNVFVREDGALILLDFGAVAQLSPQMRAGIPEFLEGVLRRDTDRLDLGDAQNGISLPHQRPAGQRKNHRVFPRCAFKKK